MSLREQITSRFKVARWSGDEATIACPHPDHEDRNPSASINIRKRKWVCYSCGRGGNLEDLLGGYIADERVEDVLTSLARELSNDGRVKVYPESWLDQFESDEVHPYWLSRGLSDALCRKFRLGYDPITDRVTYPLRSPSGAVLGVVKRSRGAQLPKYQYPPGTKVSDTLFGYHLVQHGIGDIVLVEGALDALAMWDVGIPSVAQFGSRLSNIQIDLLRKLGLRTLTLAYDQDQAGREALERAVINRRLNFCPLRIMRWDSRWKDPMDLRPVRRIEAYQNAELVWGGEKERVVRMWKL